MMVGVSQNQYTRKKKAYHINLFVILFDKKVERGETTNNKWDFYWFIPTAI